MNNQNVVNSKNCLNSLNNMTNQMFEDLELSNYSEDSYCINIRHKFENCEYYEYYEMTNNSELFQDLEQLLLNCIENGNNSEYSKLVTICVNSECFELYINSELSKYLDNSLNYQYTNCM